MTMCNSCFKKNKLWQVRDGGIELLPLPDWVYYALNTETTTTNQATYKSRPKIAMIKSYCTKHQILDRIRH